MSTLPLKPGDSVTLSRTVTEADIVNFAGVSGDFAPNHMDDAYMSADGRGGRIAHGALLIAWSSAASTRIAEAIPDDSAYVTVSLGYDRIRFLKPVRIGDTITVDYRIEDVDTDALRTKAAITFRNQRDECVAVATHILKLAPREKLFGANGD